MILCRSLEVRKRLIYEYEIKPIAHIRLLNGQIRKSCTGDKLTDSYYCFSYRKLNEGGNSETFLCGTHAANSFLELLNHSKLPLFDPLGIDNHGAGNSSSNGNMIVTWRPAAKQLYNAIHLLIICWGIVPGSVLKDIKSKLEVYTDREPLASQVKSLNTIISKDKHGRTLQEMIEEFRDANEKLRQFQFDLLRVILSRNNVANSYFG
ncbi:hypothetical protein [Paenibacillus sp. FSL K6-2524]|uniref:hypothetical protein n=1 Tax=Paenibacillus sp. FSL K6-2524 TaxID=2954516 RepID=UPI0030FCDCA9